MRRQILIGSEGGAVQKKYLNIAYRLSIALYIR